MVAGFLRRRSSAPQTKVPRAYRAPEGERVYAVGDIHGRSTLLKKMMAAIEADRVAFPAARCTEIFLGDYIDRGMDSRGVLESLMGTPAEGVHRVCLMGNHEMALLAFLKDPMTLREWGNFGGYATLASYGIAIPTRMTPDALMPLRVQLQLALGGATEFLAALPYFYPWGDYLFVHAGILPGVALEDQSRETLLRIREPFLSDPSYHSHYVVHGHTPRFAPELLHNRANLDVSDAHPESLACLVIEGESKRLLVVSL